MSNTRRFDESMRDLRSQIHSLGTDDDRFGQLGALADDIEEGRGSTTGEAAHAKLGERLTASILQFEGSHPRIAYVLTELAEKLADIGI
jgi:hypothetical protein